MKFIFKMPAGHEAWIQETLEEINENENRFQVEVSESWRVDESNRSAPGRKVRYYRSGHEGSACIEADRTIERLGSSACIEADRTIERLGSSSVLPLWTVLPDL